MSATSIDRAGAPIALVCILLIAASSASLADSPQPSNPPSETTKPIFLVWGHTDLPDQGAPTLDVVDVERYFATCLDARRVENVGLSSTAHIVRPVPANMYLLDLRVDAIQLTYRSSGPIFSVELSLQVKNMGSGEVLGATGERYEYPFASDYDATRLDLKRGAIETAVDRVAERFVNLAAQNRFGGALNSIQSPPPPIWERCLNGDRDAVAEVVVGGVIGIFLFGCIVIGVNQSPHRSNQAPASPSRGERERVASAVALALSTNGFSEEACIAAAALDPNDVLRDARSIEQGEAARQVEAKTRTADHRRIAARVSTGSELSPAAIADTLGKAEEWPYRVLQAAKHLAQEDK